MDIKRMVLILTFLSKSRISADSQLGCGCELKVLPESQITADCSNRRNINFTCLEEMNPDKIFLQNNNYTEVPSELFELRFNTTQHIDFSNNAIDHLPVGLLVIFPNIKFANFSHNNLTNPMDIFLIDKKEINLSIDHNKFTFNCTAKDIVKLHKHAKKVNARLIDGSSRPLTAVCHEQFYSERPHKESGIFTVFLIGGGCAVFGFMVFYCCK